MRALFTLHSRFQTKLLLCGAAAFAAAGFAFPAAPSAAPHRSRPVTGVIVPEETERQRRLLTEYHEGLKRAEEQEEKKEKVRPIVVLDEFGLLTPFELVVEDMESSEPSSQSVMQRVGWQARYLGWR